MLNFGHGLRVLTSLAAMSLIGAIAVYGAGCGGGGGSPQISPQLLEGISIYQDGQAQAIASVQVVKNHFTPDQLIKVESDYAKLSGHGIGWVNSVSLGIRTAALDDPKNDDIFRQKALDAAPALNDLTNDVNTLIQTKAGNKVFNPITAANFLMGATDWFLNHRAAEEQLRQLRQAERDRIADEVLQCGTWPSWSEITDKYKSNCKTIAPGPLPSVTTLPTPTSSR